MSLEDQPTLVNLLNFQRERLKTKKNSLDPQKRWTEDTYVLQLDQQSGIPTTVVMFAGNRACFDGNPLFEFFNLFTSIPVHRIFVRDPNRLWYQRGIPGFGGNVYDIAAYLKSQCKLRNSKRIITVGSSAGGYAAILFGLLLQAEQVHAFSPQTRLLDPRDFRKPERLALLHQCGGEIDLSLDLRKCLVLEKKSPTTIYIYYAKHNLIDSRHARYLRDFPNVRLIKYPFWDHAIVHILKQHGILKRLFRAAIFEDPRQICTATRKSQLQMYLRYAGTILLRNVLSALTRSSKLGQKDVTKVT